MIAKWYKNMLKKHFEFKGIWKGSSSRRNEQNFKGMSSSKDDTNYDTYYDCGLLSHMNRTTQTLKRKERESNWSLRKHKEKQRLQHGTKVIALEMKVKMKKLTSSISRLEKA